MDTARQILRFSVPGSIFLLHAFLCYLIFRRLQGVLFIDASTTIKDNIAAVVAILSTIPIGFIVYQIYYFTYEPVIRLRFRPWGGRFVRRDRAWEILQKLNPEQIANLEDILGCGIDLEEPHTVVPGEGSYLQKLMRMTGVLEVAGECKALPMEGKERQHAYEGLWYSRWDALRSVIDIAGAHEGAEQVKTEYTALSDIYHALGAARTAVLGAWLGVSILSFSHLGRTLNGPVAAFGGFILISAITAAIYGVFHVARGRTWRSAAVSLTAGLRWFHWRHGHQLGRGGGELG